MAARYCQVAAKTPEEAADLLINKVLGTFPVQPQKKTQWERLLTDDGEPDDERRSASDPA